jgi:hypothetical protein
MHTKRGRKGAKTRASFVDSADLRLAAVLSCCLPSRFVQVREDHQRRVDQTIDVIGARVTGASFGPKGILPSNQKGPLRN